MSFVRFAAVLFLAGLLSSIARADIISDFSQVEEIWGAEIAPDGNSVALGCREGSERAVCIFSLVEEKPPARFPAPKDAKIVDFYWASPKHAIIVADYVENTALSDGMQEIRFTRGIAYNIETNKSAVLMNNSLGFSNTAYAMSLALDNPDKILMAAFASFDSNRTGTRIRRGDSEDVYIAYNVDLDSGTARRRDIYRQSVVSILFDGQANDLFRTVYDDESDRFLIKDQNGKTIYQKTGVEIRPLSVRGFSDDGNHLILWSSGVADIERGVWKLPITGGELSRVQVNDVTIGTNSPITDRYTNKVVGYFYTDDLRGQYFTDPQLADYANKLEKALGGQRVRIASWTRDRRMFVVIAEQPGRPITYYLFEPAANELSVVGLQNQRLSERPLGTIEAVEYAAADGLTIPAYLTLPPNKTQSDGPFPTILMPHGGPDAADTASFHWWAQAYAAAGYAVLQPNFRGSNSYGADFRAAGFGEFGGKMVTDVLDGLKWMEGAGIAEPGAACIIGASYGGYSALMAPLLRSSDVKCAVSVNGVTDPIAMMGEYRRFRPGSEAVSYWEQYMGPLFTNPEAHVSITPLDRVREYRVPVLLIHGDEDTRVPFSQFQGFKNAAGDASWLKTYTMPGEDHFLGTQTARETVLRETFAFLAEHNPAQ